jgi:hypothetical protein
MYVRPVKVATLVYKSVHRNRVAGVNRYVIHNNGKFTSRIVLQTKNSTQSRTTSNGRERDHCTHRVLQHRVAHASLT